MKRRRMLLFTRRNGVRPGASRHGNIAVERCGCRKQGLRENSGEHGNEQGQRDQVNHHPPLPFNHRKPTRSHVP